MNPYWNPLLHDLAPYTPGEQPKQSGLIKLNTNENPYGPSPRVSAAMQAELSTSLRLYPDPNSQKLKEAIVHYYRAFKLRPNQVFVGNGSDEVLAHAFYALLGHSGPVLMPDISYSFYPVWCALYGIDYEPVPLDQHFQINLRDYYRPCGGIIFANPNAPTGGLLGLSLIAQLLEANPHSLLVLDEAYIDFGGKTACALINQYPNLLVVQTLSKSRALAGLRVGFALGHPELIEALERVKNSFNSYPLDRLASAGAIASFEDEEYFAQNCAKIVQSRKLLSQGLSGLGFRVLPSAANFVFATHPRRDAAWLAGWLREQGILVRHFKQPRIEQFLRISIGTPDQQQALITALASLPD
ncbi:histidinol-phosphate aminotransferase [Ventosimonas gracilis]|uniref:Histidinol-phosphate aminotransferase n=1 Tax=Ventosimonas gracilis TaxID=1680762 RepID=A0A139SX25_9GAMM|nr:histidinol-phosphate transaminase [Ventosimonas gracilis]KXU39167.1 histidinol-phosphate aminotransferase [Ventosimonas gracilis]